MLFRWFLFKWSRQCFLSFLCAFSLFMSSCASLHHGTTIKEGGLIISVRKNIELSSEKYSFMEYTFENPYKDTKEVRVTQLGFPGATQSQVLVDDSLNEWLREKESKFKMSSWDTFTFQAAVVVTVVYILLGVATVIVGGSYIVPTPVSSHKPSGFHQVVGSTEMLNIEKPMDGVSLSHSQAPHKIVKKKVKVPESHLIAPFQMKPKSYIKKWALIQRTESLPEGQTLFIRLKVNHLKGGKSVKNLRFHFSHTN